MSDDQAIVKAPRGAEAARPLILLRKDGTRYIFDRERVTLGRAKSCDIVVSDVDTCVSPTHVIFSRGKKGWTIMDADSVNGTWLNNRKLEPRSPHVLRNTAVITIQMLRGLDDLSYYIKNNAWPSYRQAPDGTIILNGTNLTYSYQFICFDSLRENKQPRRGKPFLKYDQDGNLYSDIPSPEYLSENAYKQCEHCGAFAEDYEDICPCCGKQLPEERSLYVDPVVCTVNYQSIADELNSIIHKMYPRQQRGLSLYLGTWKTKQMILREQYHILWRTPSEMNPYAEW